MVALGVQAALDVCVRQLVDQYHLRPPREDCVHVHLLKQRAFVLQRNARHLFQLPCQLRRARAAMCLHKADYDVLAAAAPTDRLAQHTEGFADPGRVAEEYLEPAALLAFGRGQPLLRAFRLDYRAHCPSLSSFPRVARTPMPSSL